jgi:hypothetical protein
MDFTVRTSESSFSHIVILIVGGEDEDLLFIGTGRAGEDYSGGGLVHGG